MRTSSLKECGKTEIIIEIGPRFNFSTPDSTNSVSICHNVSLTEIKRLEISIKYQITFKPPTDDPIPDHIIVSTLKTNTPLPLN